jgi:hypothetical protein
VLGADQSESVAPRVLHFGHNMTVFLPLMDRTMMPTAMEIRPLITLIISPTTPKIISSALQLRLKTLFLWFAPRREQLCIFLQEMRRPTGRV